MTIDPQGVAPADVEAVLARTAGVRSSFTATEREVAVGDQTFQARVLGGDLARTGYVIRQGRMLAGPGEVVIGYGLVRRLGLRVGDRLALQLGDRRLDVRIVGRYAESEDSGERAMITLADLRRVEPGADPDGVYVEVAPGFDRRRVARAITASLPGVEVEVEEAELDEFDAFRAAFYVISLLVLAVGLVNLAATTMLAIRERTQDIAVLKTVGFTPRQVALSIAVGTGAVATGAVLAGVPVGLLAANRMLDAVGRSSGFGPELAVSPGPGPLCVAALALVAMAAGLGALVARRTARAHVVDALRAE